MFKLLREYFSYYYEYGQHKIAENHKELIRGSVLDPDNHPSKDRQS